MRNRAVISALGGTILTEILALALLAVVVESRGSAVGWAFWAGLALPFAAYGALVLWALPRVGRWFFRNAGEGGTEFVFVLAALFTVSWLAHLGRVEPLIGALLCVFLMTKLEALTWARFGGWMAIGLAIYFFYGMHNSKLRRAEADAA